MPEITLLLYLVAMVMLAAMSGKAGTLARWQKWVSAGVGALAVIITFLYLYVSWTSPQNGKIDGVQGRYFVPLLPLFIILIPEFFRSSPWIMRYQGLVATLSSATVWMSALVVVVLKFYVTCGAAFTMLNTCFLPVTDGTFESVPLAPLVQGVKIEQVFTAQCNHLSRLKVPVSTPAGNSNAMVTFQLLEGEAQQVVKEFSVDANALVEGDPVFLMFDPINASKGKTFHLIIQSDADGENGLIFNKVNGDPNPFGHLWIDGVAQDGGLIFEYGCKTGID